MSYTKEVFKRLESLSLGLSSNPPPPAGQYVSFRLHAALGFLAAQTSGAWKACRSNGRAQRAIKDA
jgi:hypothetical protein